MKDPYLYPHSDVLRNKAGIKNRGELEKMEGDLTVMRLAELASSSQIERFDFNSLCQIHYHIFQDIYDWAGKPRIINIHKSEPVLAGLSVDYSDCFDIANDAGHVLKEMNKFPWQKESFDSVVKNYSRYMAELWKVHPFREGNTRTVVTFCNYFMVSKGYTLNLDLYKDNAEYVRTALVAANAIFSDLGDRRKPEYLERIVADSLKESWQEQRGKSVLGKLQENKAKLEKKSGEKGLSDKTNTKMQNDIER